MKHTNIFKKSKLVFALTFLFLIFSANDSFSQGQGTVESYQINSETNSSRTPRVARPPRLSVNDLILVNIWWRNNEGTGNITPPSGYTAIATRRNGELNMTSFYKLATATDVAATAFTFTNLFSSNVFWSISATRVSGVNQSMPITNISSNSNVNNTTNHSISPFTPDVNYSFVVAYFATFATDRSVTYTHPGGYTENYDAQVGDNSTNRRTGTMVYIKQGTRAVTNNITSVSSTSRPFVGIGFAINMDSTYARPCVFPVYDVRNFTGGTNNGLNSTRYTQLLDAADPDDDIHIKYTFVNRSSSGVGIDNWDQQDGNNEVYRRFWQPIIDFNSGSSTDTAWAEFRVEFSSSSASNETNFNNNRKSLPCLALTVIDLDGGGQNSTNVLREIIQVTESNVAMGIGTSAITYGRVGKWMTLVSGHQVYNNIDSTIQIAMAQINFEDVDSFRIRLGVLGSRSNIERQFSLRFISYEELTTPLPVTYSYFNAKPSNNKVHLEWETTSEINNSHFEIEKTMDGEYWYTIGTVEGAGNSYGAQFYSFDDNSPAQGLNVYRLKQVDWNGDFEYSSNKTVIWGGESPMNTVNVFPNPGTEKIYISGVENPKVTIYNLAGTVQFQSENKNELNLQFLQNGVYFIQIQSLSGEVSRIKFIKN